MKNIAPLLLVFSLLIPVSSAHAACAKNDFRCEQRELMGGQSVNGDTFRPSDEQQARTQRIQQRQAAQQAAAQAPSSQSATTPPGPATDAQKQADASAKKVEELTDKGETLGCGSAGEYGGSMSNALGNSFDNTIRDIVGSGVQALRGKAQDFINTIAQKAGPAAPFVQAVAQKVMPLVDKTLTDLGNKALGALGINTGSLGNVAQALGITGGAGTALSSALSAAGLGGAAAGAAGLFVPTVEQTGQLTNDTAAILAKSKLIEQHTEIVKQMQKLFGYVTCVANPGIAKTKHALIAEQQKAHMEFYQQMLIQSIEADIQTAIEIGVKDVIDNRTAGMCATFKPNAQRLALGEYQYSNNFARQTQCGTSQAAQEVHSKTVPEFEPWFKTQFFLGDQQIFNTSITLDEIAKVEKNTAAKLLIEYEKNDGWYNDVKCRDDREPSPKGYCLNGEIVKLPGSLVADQAAYSFTVPTRQLEEADEIGELIDTLSQGLLQFAFENIDGLMGLSSDSGEEGSYLDQMVNASYSRDDVQTTITDDLQGALAVEEQYYDLVSLILSDFTTVRTTYESVKTCYAPFVTTPSASISTTLATDTMHLASTTITTLAPEITEFTALRNDSQLALDELSFLIERTQAALTQEDMVSVSNDFSALRASGVMHNATDLQYLETSARASVETIELLLLDGQIKLNVCKAG